jgi:hypothetical protein
MDPYEILGVSRSASPDEIRDAYRTLAKRYHPDVNPSPDAVERTSAINAAYDLLTSPEQKASFDGYNTPSYEVEEDPLEAYKREYKARKFREAREKKAARLRNQARVYWVGRMLSFPSALLSIIVILDFFLPSNVVHEMPLSGYQRVFHSKHGADVESHMKTANHDIVVPDEMHIDYDYYAVKKLPIYLEFTPLLKTLKRIGVDYEKYSIVYTAPKTPYNLYFFPLPFIILGISIIFIRKKEFSIHRYPFCLFPFVISIILFFRILASQ